MDGIHAVPRPDPAPADEGVDVDVDVAEQADLRPDPTGTRVGADAVIPRGPRLHVARPATPAGAGAVQNPGAGPTVEQVAAMLEQLAAADIDSTVAVLDELLDRLRPASQVRRALIEVPPEVLREASLLVARRRRTGTGAVTT